MVKKLTAIIAISILLISQLTGCMDSAEVDDSVYAVTIGLDKGVNNKIILTVQYPTYKGGSSSSGGKKGGGGDANIHTIEAPSILEGLDLLNMAISRRVSLLHTKLFVISEEVAREDITSFLAPIARYRATRMTVFVVITKGKAVDFIQENKSNIGESITKAIELMMEQSKNTGFFSTVSFFEFYKDMTSSYGQPHATYAGVNDFQKLKIDSGRMKSPLVTEPNLSPGSLPRIGIAKREFVGTAIFKGPKMVGYLDPYETRYFLMLTGKFHTGIMSLKDKNGEDKVIPLSLRLGRKTKVKGKFVETTPVIDILVNIEADIGAIQSRINYEDKNKIEDLNDQIKDVIEIGLKKVIAKTQKEYKSDVFDFGKELAGYFPTIQEWEKYNWLEHYPEAKVNIDVIVNVRRTGLTIDSAPIIDDEE